MKSSWPILIRFVGRAISARILTAAKVHLARPGRGRTLAEVRDAVGHVNISMTSAYLHVAVGTLFGLLGAANFEHSASRRTLNNNSQG